ncbi:hypothetical protein [Microvirgula aerodenitrificans]|uniref:hypothetical protein n=1 Tax=Microvirgula aerodenitrificans TaxID=57480 RepID=UPI0028E414F9|nr:hypothetical protein [Microvirgula aerodenitrificans]
MKTLMLRLSRLPRLLLVLAFLVGTLLFGFSGAALQTSEWGAWRVFALPAMAAGFLLQAVSLVALLGRRG